MEEDKKRREERQKRRLERRKQEAIRTRKILTFVMVGALFLISIGMVVNMRKLGSKMTAEKAQKVSAKVQKVSAEVEKESESVSITVSAAGDCTLGTDQNFDYLSSLAGKYDAVNNPAYFLQKVQPIFAEDDLTIVNMEGTLTEEITRADKMFAFKAEPEYAGILTAGNVEAVNLANNHSRDYGEKSYTDTISALDAAGVVSFGYDRTAVMDIKGVKIGLLGTYELAGHMGCEADMIANIESLKEQGAQIIIASFHWGSELANIPDDVQIALAHSAIDNGADLVLGHHPHVLQGIEEYKGKNIVYSMGNFCFGGNSGPADMDTMIFQQTFTVEEESLKKDNVTNIIPCKISSSYAAGVNDYQPMPAEGDMKENILSRIREYSEVLSGEDAL